jgi:hypothetical protein
MEGISKRSRLRTVAVAALVASGIVLMAMSGSTSAMSGSKQWVKRISLGIRNSSHTAIQAQICPSPHARQPHAPAEKPCSEITQTYVIQPGHVHIVSNSWDVGAIITCAPGSCPDPDNRKTLNFYAANDAIFLPFFVAEGERIGLRQGQFVDRTKHYVHYELGRYADEDRDGENVKLMRIEIQRWPGAPHSPCKRRASRAAPRLPGC